TAELIAYPLLPGDPGLTIDERGGPRWHFDVESPEYAASLGNFLAELHTVDPALVRDSGIPELSPAEVRQHKREDIDRVVSEFEVAPELSRRWNQWLDDDSYWPTFTTVTHGEVYPAHQLMDGPTNLSILDWTTAAISDPARDFMFHRASVSAAVFEATMSHPLTQWTARPTSASATGRPLPSATRPETSCSTGQASRPRSSKRRSPTMCKPVVESGRDSPTTALSSIRPPPSNSACLRCRQEIPSFCQRREPN